MMDYNMGSDESGDNNDPPSKIQLLLARLAAMMQDKENTAPQNAETSSDAFAGQDESDPITKLKILLLKNKSRDSDAEANTAIENEMRGGKTFTEFHKNTLR